MLHRLGGRAAARQEGIRREDEMLGRGAAHGAATDRLLLTVDVFRLTRPLAQTDPGTNVFHGVRYTTPLGRHALTVRAQVINLTDTHYYSALSANNIVGSPGRRHRVFRHPADVHGQRRLDL